MPVCQQKLMFAGHKLGENNKTLAEYNICNESTIHMIICCFRGGKQIFVKTLTGKTMTMDVDDTNTI